MADNGVSRATANVSLWARKKDYDEIYNNYGYSSLRNGRFKQDQTSLFVILQDGRWLQLCNWGEIYLQKLIAICLLQDLYSKI